MDALSVLLEGLIDYAGLYPPASLPMEAAVRNYAGYAAGPRASWLGRFVLPAARLDEFVAARRGRDSRGREDLPLARRSLEKTREPGEGPWRLSALLGEAPEADLERVIAFNRAAHASARPFAVIEAFEMKPESPRDIVRLEALSPAGVAAFFEIPLREPGPFLAALAAGNGRAKFRTGGVTPETIPAAADLARGLAACAAARVPFKATAGLHHPFRSFRPLTYAPDSPQAMMHGFVNVFLAAAFAAQGMDVATLAVLIAEESPAAFAFAHGRAAWRGHHLKAERLHEARRDFALAFGSCSFDEPRQDLEAAGWL
jgi:hypothetical protein